jgi:hypothetical protein
VTRLSLEKFGAKVALSIGIAALAWLSVFECRMRW